MDSMVSRWSAASNLGHHLHGVCMHYCQYIYWKGFLTSDRVGLGVDCQKTLVPARELLEGTRSIALFNSKDLQYKYITRYALGQLINSRRRNKEF